MHVPSMSKEVCFRKDNIPCVICNSQTNQKTLHTRKTPHSNLLRCSERKLESRRKAAEEARRNAEEEQRREETLLQQVNDRAAQRQQLAEAGQPQLIRAEVC
jgi:hypothetical protein